jgi:hypothetical protein
MWAASPKLMPATCYCAVLLIPGYSFLSHCSTRASSLSRAQCNGVSTTNAELSQKPSHGRRAQSHIELILDRFSKYRACPQRKLEFNAASSSASPRCKPTAMPGHRVSADIQELAWLSGRPNHHAGIALAICISRSAPHQRSGQPARGFRHLARALPRVHA